MVKAFYQSVHYEPIRERAVPREGRGGAGVVSNRVPALRTRMLDYFEERAFERMGVLHGEYLLHPSGLLLLDRAGFVTAACVAMEDPSIPPWLAGGVGQFDGPEYAAVRGALWETFPLANRMPILSDPYERNFYHFTMELAPRLRFYPSLSHSPFLISKAALEKPFQTDLLRRCMAKAGCHALDGFLRVRDPLMAHDAMSEEGVFWLRGASGLSASAGDRRIYIRRSGPGTRSEGGGGVCESEGFVRFLADRNFEWVEFGQGELGLAEQVARLEGAGLILAAHGAALSNLAFLNGDVKVIEVLGPRTHRAMFMHLSAMLGFSYYGLTSAERDANGDTVVDLDELGEAIGGGWRRSGERDGEACAA